MPTIQDHGDVDVEQIAVRQLPLAWDAVADDVLIEVRSTWDIRGS